MVLLGSSLSERDQVLFISRDEGSSFQRQSLSFSPDTLMFHPQDQDKLLAYCRDGRVGSCSPGGGGTSGGRPGSGGPSPCCSSSHAVLSLLVLQLFASVDLGHRWTLLQERVTKDRVYWSVLVLVLTETPQEGAWLSSDHART